MTEIFYGPTTYDLLSTILDGDLNPEERKMIEGIRSQFHEDNGLIICENCGDVDVSKDERYYGLCGHPTQWNNG